MKSKKFDLLANTVTTYGDTTKTFITSRIALETIDGKSVLRDSPNRFIPVYDDCGFAPTALHITSNERIFTINAPGGSGLARISCYDFNSSTGLTTYVGTIAITLLTGTQTIRGFKVYDGLSSGSVTGWKIFVATTCSTTANGGLYMVNSIDKTDFALSPPTIPTATLTDQKAVYKLENSPFTLTSPNGMGLDATPSIIYLRNGSASVYQVAKFNFTGSTGAPGAGGIITTYTTFVTGNLPVTSGTLQQNNSDNLITPGHGPNAGSLCYLFSTNSTTYHGKISDLAAAVTSWPSLASSNYVPGSTYTTQTMSAIAYSQTLDRLISLSGTGEIYVKRLLSNEFDYLFGTAHSIELEAGAALSIVGLPVGGISTTSIDSNFGWTALLLTATGQRGLIITATSNDQRWEHQYIITPVLDIFDASSLVLAKTLKVLNTKSLDAKLQYRLSGFASETSGWLAVPADHDLSAITPSTGQIQFRVLFRKHEQEITVSPGFNELFLLYNGKFENSEKWHADVENSSKSTESPGRSAIILIKAYPTSVPTIEMKAYSRLTGTLVAQKNTSSDASEFEYSSDSGSTWNALGTIPNTINTTRLRYNWSSPIPGDIDLVWSEL